MATNAKWIYDRAIYLMDEADPDSGVADTDANRDFRSRTLSILNVLQVECAAASAGFSPQAGERRLPALIPDFDTDLELDDGLCRGVLPYGLAAHLLLESNPGTAAFFYQRYTEALTDARRSLPQKSEPIEDLYGGIELGQFGRW